MASGPYVPTPAVRIGAQKLCELPDSGPWKIVRFAGEVYAASQQSGVYLLRGNIMVPVEPLPVGAK